VRIDD